MRKSPLNKIGKIGRRNLNASKTLKYIFNDYGITRCELCGSDYALTFAHKERREWYRSAPSLLSDFKHAILLCQSCHSVLDDRSKTTEKEKNNIFGRLRP